jgi:diguanylate cyclase (GGDEF)-like protein
MIDVDHFKRVNDTYGHPGGDCILIGVSDCVRKIVGRRGRAYRSGGEELAVLLPHFAAEEAFYVAERIRRAIANTVWKHDDQELRVTISIGVATTPHSTTASHGALLKAADDAMYKAKRGGRNRTCLAEGLEPEPVALTPPTAGDHEQCPDLRGTWQGRLHSGWVDPNTNLRQEPREVFMSIKQTDATVHMRLLTTESQSVSLAAAIVQAADGQWSLNSIYRNEPGHSARHRSPIHHGGMILRVGGPPPTSMSGDYWVVYGSASRQHRISISP